MVVPRYFWTPQSPLSIDDYLKKTKPSLVTSKDSDWIWVDTGKGQGVDAETMGLAENEQAKAIGRAQVVLDDLSKRLDESIPVRAKKGQKSKKVVREEAHAQAAEQLKKISIDSGWTSGKWMVFPNTESVDRMWGQIARSVAHGPLHDAGVYQAKVAPSSGEDRHLICMYFANVYDLDAVRKILTALLFEHGIEPSSVKSNLYTVVGIDSNHPTKLRSTIWRPSEVIDGGGPAIKALKEHYKPAKEAARNKAAATAAGRGEPPRPTSPPPATTESSSADRETSKSVTFEAKAQEKVRTRPIDDDGVILVEKPAKRAKTAAMLYKENDMFADSDDDD